jgi:hypothetical protein
VGLNLSCAERVGGPPVANSGRGQWVFENDTQ